MYRIVGCILVVAAGAGMGFSGSMRLSEQIRILEKLLQMVPMISRGRSYVDITWVQM